MLQKLNVIANIATLIVALLIVGILVRNNTQNLPHRPEPTQLIGKTAQIPNQDWSTSEKNVVLVLSDKCHFCTESAPFYERLVRSPKPAGVRFMAAFVQTAEEGRAYLTRLGVPLADIKQVSLSSLGVSGTPTLLLVDRSGVIRRVWRGKLSADQEQDVMKVLEAHI